jgi:ribosomal protein L11 methyltransferase
MKYFNVTVHSDRKRSEEAESLLFSIGAESVSESADGKSVSLTALFPESGISAAMNDPRMKQLDPDIQELPDKEWVDEWIRYYDPVYLGEDFVIVPNGHSGEIRENGAIRLVIDPRGAFGSGTHPTTLLCLSNIKKLITQKKLSGDVPVTVVDIGTGSGILAIAAEKCGADIIDAYDIDPKSVEKTRENIQLNDCRSVNVYLSSVENNHAAKKYTIVIANLQSGIIEANIDTIVNAADVNGTILLSGIYVTWKRDIEKLLDEKGFSIVSSETMNDWACITAERK